MVDQVNPTGGLSPGPPLTLQAVVEKPQPVKDRPSTQKTEAAAVKKQAAKLSYASDAGPEESERAVDAINDYLKQARSDVMFQVDKDTGISYFRIVNSVTKEVVLQVPSEEILSMARKLRAMASHKDASGVLVDEEG